MVSRKHFLISLKQRSFIWKETPCNKFLMKLSQCKTSSKTSYFFITTFNSIHVLNVEGWFSHTLDSVTRNISNIQLFFYQKSISEWESAWKYRWHDIQTDFTSISRCKQQPRSSAACPRRCSPRLPHRPPHEQNQPATVSISLLQKYASSAFTLTLWE